MQHQMVVRAAGNELHAAFCQAFGKRFSVFYGLLGVGLKLRLQRFAEAHGFCGDNVHQRAALRAGENGFVDLPLPYSSLAEDHAAARAAQRFVRGCGDNVGIRHRGRVQPRGDKTRDVRHIHHQIRADLHRQSRGIASKSITRG